MLPPYIIRKDVYKRQEWNLVIENGLYPNMLAIAERAWRGGGTEYFDGLGTICLLYTSGSFL